MAKKLALDDASAAVVRKALCLDEVLPDLKAVGVSTLFPSSALYEYAADEHIIEQEEEGRD